MEHRLSEIIANAITHGIGAALAIIGAVILILASVAHGTMRHVFSCAVFGGTLILVSIRERELDRRIWEPQFEAELEQVI